MLRVYKIRTHHRWRTKAKTLTFNITPRQNCNNQNHWIDFLTAKKSRSTHRKKIPKPQNFRCKGKSAVVLQSSCSQPSLPSRILCMLLPVLPFPQAMMMVAEIYHQLSPPIPFTNTFLCQPLNSPGISFDGPFLSERSCWLPALPSFLSVSRHLRFPKGKATGQTAGVWKRRWKKSEVGRGRMHNFNNNVEIQRQVYLYNSNLPIIQTWKAEQLKCKCTWSKLEIKLHDIIPKWHDVMWRIHK